MRARLSLGHGWGAKLGGSVALAVFVLSACSASHPESKGATGEAGSSGCGCRVVGTDPSSPAWAPLAVCAVAAVGGARLRRRRGRTSNRTAGG
jgi:hypothetical protein